MRRLAPCTRASVGRLARRGGLARRAVVGAALVALALGLAACLGRSPEAHLYTLRPIAPPAEASAASGPALAVGRVRLPGYLERNEIVTRAEGERIELHDLHRWAASLDAELGRVLALALGRHLGSERVSADPGEPAWTVAARVSVSLDRLDGRLGEAVTLEGHFSVVAVRGRDLAGADGEGAGSRLLAAERVELREPVRGRTMDALVAAHSRVVGALAREIAAAVREAGL